MSGPRLRFSRADGLIVLTALVWGVNFPVSKYVLAYLPPMFFASVRFFLASGILFLVLAARGKRSAIGGRDFFQLLGLGILGVTLFQLLWANGLTLTEASTASILLNTSPVWTAVLASLSGQRQSARGIAGIIACFLGTFLVINNSLTRLTLGGGTLTGNAMFIGAAILWALYSMLGCGPMIRLGPLKTTAWAMLLGSILLFPIGLMEVRGAGLALVPATAWTGFAFTIVIPGAIGYVWWYEGIRALGVARVMIYSYLVPVFAVITAVLFLGEHFSTAEFVGAVIVFAGVQIARTG